MKKALRGFWSSLKKAFAIRTGNFTYLSLEEARDCFKEATNRKEPGNLQVRTVAWDLCFAQWLSQCETKGACMDPFFTVFDLQYCNQYHGWAPNPLREEAAMKWLRLIEAGEITKKDEDHIWHLSTTHWGQGEKTRSHHVAHALRDAIAMKKIKDTDDPEELNVAGGYASSSRVKRLAAEKRDAIRKAK